jgi:hypothetical protein
LVILPKNIKKKKENISKIFLPETSSDEFIEDLWSLFSVFFLVDWLIRRRSERSSVEFQQAVAKTGWNHLFVEHFLLHSNVNLSRLVENELVIGIGICVLNLLCKNVVESLAA